MALSELKGHLEATSSEIIPRIKDLEKKNVIYKDGDKYRLTPLGMILAKKVQMMVNLSGLLEENARFINDHDLSAIPEHLLYRMDELGKCMLVECSVDNIAATYWTVLDYLSKSQVIKGISPMCDPYYPEYFLKVAQLKKPVTIILTRNIFDKIEKEYAETLQAYLKCDNAKLCVIDDARLAFAVTDKFVSISLYHKNGNFDALTNLISFERSAIAWGEELFEYYMQKSVEIKSSSYAK